jgi:predicted RNase H-like nuclease (RuvC/YqgF family)
MQQDKISVGARISRELYNKCLQDYGSMTNAINAGLELLYSKDVNNCKQDVNGFINSVNTNVNDVNDIKLINEKDYRISDLNKRIAFLEEQLQTKDKHIERLNIQNENLTESLKTQTINIHGLLTQKVIEAPGAKKPWWRFW